MRFCVYAPRVVFVPAFILVIVTFATVFASLVVPVETAQATTPKILYYQGKISKRSDGTNITDGNYSMQFKMYDAASAGTLLWTETWDGGTSQVAFVNGMFSAALGTYVTLPSFTGGSVYLTVNFNSGSGYDGEMSPRQQITASAYALVANGVSGDGAVNSTLQSATALTVANSGSNYALQVDTNTASSVTGLKVTSNTVGNGVALTTISSGTNENITLDAKGSGSITIGTAAGSTGDILLGGGSGSTGCTVTNSTGAFACTAGGSFTTMALTGAVTGAASYNGLVITANTGVITTGTWNGTAINAGFVNFNSTNLQNSSNALNTIQNINTSATPQFARIGMGAAADSTALYYGALGAGSRLIASTQSAGDSSGVSIVDLATTWNNAGNTPTAIKLNVTDTASNANSLLFDIGTGGGSYVSKFKVNKAGNITAAGTVTLTGSVTATGSLTLNSAAGNGITLDSAGAGTAAIAIGTTNATTVTLGRTGQSLQLKGVTTLAANGVLYLKNTNGDLEETAASTGTQCLVSASAGAAPTWGSCGGGGASFDTIGDPAGNGAINMGTTVQTLDWGAITTTDALSVTSSGTGLTSGSVFKVTSATTGAVTNGIVQLLGSANYSGAGGLLNVTANSTTAGALAKFSGTGLTTGSGIVLAGGTAMTTGTGLEVSGVYNHSGSETGSLAKITFTDSTSSAVTSTTNGLLISPTISLLGGAATRTINGLSVNPSFTGCPAGTCTVNGINIASVTDGTGFTGTGLKIGSGWDTGLDITTSAAATGLNIFASAAPTTDMAFITNGTNSSVTDGANALNIDYDINAPAATDISALKILLSNTSTSNTGTAIGLKITADGANSNVASGTTGIFIDNLSSAQAAANEYGLQIGTGWDAGIALNDATPVMKFTTTDNTVLFNINDSSNNSLLQIRDLSTNFGSSVIAGAFIDTTSSIKEEFNRQRTTLTADTTGAQNGAFGNGGGWGVYEGGTTPNCTFSSLADTINGITRMAASGVASGCLIMMDDALNNAKLLYNRSNLPVLLMKIKPGQADSTSAIYAGMGDATDGAVAAPTNFIGFSNNNAGTLGANWVGITRSGGTQTTVTCGQAVSTTQYALLMVEVRSTSSVRFWIDTDVSNGVNFVECSSGSSTNIPSGNLAPELMWQERTGGSATNSQLDIDFYRSWQDDADLKDITLDESASLDMESSALDFDANGETLKEYGMDQLASWLTSKEDLTGQTTVMQISSDRVIAGLELITPSVTAKGLRINSISALDSGLVKLMSDTEFFGRPYFNSDTAGFAQINKGDKEVVVNFDNEYINQPIVNASLSFDGKVNDSEGDSAQEALIQSLFDQGIQYAIIKKTANGFTIVLNKPAPENIRFSWTAFAVKNPKIFHSLPTANPLSQNPTYLAPVTSPSAGEPSDTQATDGESSVQTSTSTSSNETPSDSPPSI